MSEEFISLGKELLQAVLYPVVSILAIFLINFIKQYSVKLQAQTEDDRIDKYIKLAEQLIVDTVKETNQTFVDIQKADGTFDKEAWVVAFNKTKGNVVGLLTVAEKEAIAQVYGDVDAWHNTKIEATVVDVKEFI